MGLGPLTCIDIASAVIDCKGGVVGHNIGLVEGKVVEAYAIGKLELVVDVPLILCIESDLVEVNPCCGLFLSVEAPVECHLYRSLSCIEIAQAGKTVGTGAVTHVGVECHLGLEADTCGDLVVSHVVGNIVLDVQSCVLNIVAIGEELISEVHVRLAGVILAKVACENLHEGEEIRIGTAHVLDVGVGDEQLVGEIVGETAVEVG